MLVKKAYSKPIAINIYSTGVIFNGPATIVFWTDGTKTVVKCGKGEKFDPEKAVALCFMKRALGNTGKFNNILKKAVTKYEEQRKYDVELDTLFDDLEF